MLKRIWKFLNQPLWFDDLKSVDEDFYYDLDELLLLGLRQLSV